MIATPSLPDPYLTLKQLGQHRDCLVWNNSPCNSESKLEIASGLDMGLEGLV